DDRGPDQEARDHDCDLGLAAEEIADADPQREPLSSGPAEDREAGPRDEDQERQVGVHRTPQVVVGWTDFKITPFRIEITRSVWLPTAASWVTMMNVRPFSLCSRFLRPTTSREVSVSKLPVGSSRSEEHTSELQSLR